MARRVAPDIGAADPSVARDAVMRARADDLDGPVEVVGSAVPRDLATAHGHPARREAAGVVA